MVLEQTASEAEAEPSTRHVMVRKKEARQELLWKTSHENSGKSTLIK